MSDIDLMGALGRSIERARADRKEQKVTEYTPTTEEIIRKFATGATWQHQGFTSAEAEIRRWLAAHDAEVRAAVLAEQGEPEWEYGRTHYDEGANPHTRTVTEADHTAHPPNGHRSDGSPYWNYTQVRRRKAGPWLPVEDPS